MYCPICRAEYRPGFTHCADCGVPLVEHLIARKPPGSPVVPDSTDVLWTGTDSGIYGTLTDALTAEKIEFHGRVHEVGPLPGLKTSVYAILVHPNDRSAANRVLGHLQHELELPSDDSNEVPNAILKGEPDVASNAPPPDGPGESEDDAISLPPSDYVPEDFDPEQATKEVWSGDASSDDDAAIHDMILACLRENGIGTADHEDAASKSKILVRPSDESRAREIIREIIEGTPPE
jgi:hypothetical protein